MKKEAAKKSVTSEKSKGKNAFLAQFFHSGSIDGIFCCIVFLLFGIGIIMMYSASYAYAGTNAEGGAGHYFRRQLLWGTLGLIFMFIISKVDYRILNGKLGVVFMMPVTIILMFVALLTNSDESIKRWIRIGSFSFQPSELMKFVTVLILAYVICILSDTLKTPRGKVCTPKRVKLSKFEKIFYYFIDTADKASILLLAIVAIFTLIVLIGKHLSGAILIFLIGMSMLWLGGVPKRWIVLVAVGVTAAVTLVVAKPQILTIFSDYAYERIAVWKEKTTVGSTTYWQTWQSLLAIGSGGPFGLGLGNSKQKLLYIPEPQNDFVFAVVCEELGFVGAIIILLIFAVLIIRGFMIAAKTTDYFGALLVSGIMLHIGLQIVLNIAVITDLIPNTGIPFPFFSYGGTALFILLCEMGVVLSVSRKSYLDKE
ncbi:MAG: FtsW/RodA/SpoVE family cell cycle protein [Clostridia bacterium]|nr:FtsW/RodA/SpoVE family cell cycle protein [Clostridia bacterium]